MSENLKNVAKIWFDQQIPVVPVKQKKPLIEWGQWQIKPQTTAEFEVLPWSQADGFAIICGTKLADGLYVGAVDFDAKNVTEEAKEKGHQILKKMLCTQIEETPSGGQRWIYHCHNKPRTVSIFHNECALEIIGEGKLCIMAPSQGYRRLNDNTPSIIQDLEDPLLQAIYEAGFKPKTKEHKADTWFEGADLAGKRYTGKTPPCIEALYKGSKEGERNGHAKSITGTLKLKQSIPKIAEKPSETLPQTKKKNRF